MGDSDPDDLQQELLDTGEQKGNPMTTMYDLAREEYAALGIDTEAVMEKLAAKPISVHCWQGDDVLGFDQEGGLSGGIQTTGNYPGRARTFEELTCDFEAAMALVPGAKRINLHASYAVFTDENPWVDRDAIEYKHFEPWVAWAKAHGYGIDFNPTLFGHPMSCRCPRLMRRRATSGSATARPAARSPSRSARRSMTRRSATSGFPTA